MSAENTSEIPLPQEITPFTGDLRSRGRCPDQFWDRTELLTRLRGVARVQGRSPEALLMETASRVMAFTPPHVSFASIPGKSPLSGNHGLVRIAPVGVGKSDIVSLARRLAPAPALMDGLDGHPDWKELTGLTTGEGLLDEYAVHISKEDGSPPQRVVRATRVLAVLDEIQALLSKMQQSNNTIGAMLSTLLQGGSVEMPNADPSRRRYVEEGHYRLVVTTGAQPTRLAALLATSDQGLAQRFFYVNALSEGLGGSAVDGLDPDDILDLEEDVLERLSGGYRAEMEAFLPRPVAAHDGQGICEWAQNLQPQTLELPVVGQVYLAALLEQQKVHGVANPLNAHKPRQIVALYHMLNLLHGQTQPSASMWRSTVELWNALEDARDAFQRLALEAERDRKREEDSRRIRTAVLSKRESHRGEVPPLVVSLMIRLREQARLKTLTRTKARSTFNGKMTGKLSQLTPPWTKAEVIDRAVYEGYLHEEAGVLLPGNTQ